MAKKTRLDLHLGTDFAFRFPVLDEDESEAIDITGWSLSFMIKRSARDEDDDALLTIDDAITIEGDHDADPDDNEQRAVVEIADTDTDDLESGTAAWELKRTDAGFETVLAYGDMRLFRTVHHA